MSVAYKFQSEVPSMFPKTDDATINHRPQTAEAPDRGFAGEASEGRASEAPDAGEGRAGFVENEYTHGRSQS